MKIPLQRAARCVVVAVVMAGALPAFLGSASAETPDNEQRSFTGCPLLVEKFSGECVGLLQQRLDAVEPSYGLAEDGRFGPATRIAVLDFQGRHHLPADGNVGGITADALEQEYAALAPTAATAPAAGEPSCLDQGKISDGAGGCESDGVIGGGKSVTTCMKEAVVDKFQASALQKAFTRGQFADWAHAAKQVEKIAPWVDAAKAFKCGWWDLPED